MPGLPGLGNRNRGDRGSVISAKDVCCVLRLVCSVLPTFRRTGAIKSDRPRFGLTYNVTTDLGGC